MKTTWIYMNEAVMSLKSGCCSAMTAVILVSGFKSKSLSRRSYISSGTLYQPIACSSSSLLSEPLLAALSASAGWCDTWNSAGSDPSHVLKPLRVSQRILRFSLGSSWLHTIDLPAFKQIKKYHLQWALSEIKQEKI